MTRDLMSATSATTTSAGATSFRVLAMRAAAWSTVVVTIGMLIVAVLLEVRSAGFRTQEYELTLLHPLISVLVGALVIDRRGNHVVGWLFCLSGLGWGVGYLGHAAGISVLSGGSLPGQDVLIWSIMWPPFFAFALVPALVLYVFPTGRLTSPRWRWFVLYTITTSVVGVIGYMFAPGPLLDVPALDNPYGSGGAIGRAATFMVEVCWPMLLIGIAGGVVSLRQRMRAATFSERQQIKWLVLAGAILVAFVAFWGATDVLLGRPDVAAAATGLVLPTLPLALGIAILRHRLYDIDVLINRTLVYLSLSAVLAAVYVGAVFLLQRALSPVTEDSNIAIAASTLAVAALFRPARASIQHFIDRRFYRSKYNATATLGRFATRLRDEVDMDALTVELLALVGETLQPTKSGLWLKGTDAPG